MNWTAIEEKTLPKLWNEGSTAEQIAAKFGCTRNAVIGKKKRLEEKGVFFQSRDGSFNTKRGTKTSDGEPISRKLGRSTAVEKLTKSQCRWPIGDPQDGDFSFCQSSAETGSYCATHNKMAHRPPRVYEENLLATQK